MTNSNWLLRTEGLSYHFEQKPLLSTPALALSGVGLCWVCGKNGAGKTLLLHLLSGRLLPSAGELFFGCNDDTQLVSQSMHARYELRFIADRMLGDDSLLLGRYLYQMSLIYANFDKVKTADAYENVISILGLEELLSKKIRELSLGQQRRASMAQALFGEAFCLFLDEPLTGLDREQERRMVELIRQLSKHKLVVVSGHHLESLQPDITQIFWINQQKVEVLAPTQAIILQIEQELANACV